jgi:hypothetical protein
VADLPFIDGAPGEGLAVYLPLPLSQPFADSANGASLAVYLPLGGLSTSWDNLGYDVLLPGWVAWKTNGGPSSVPPSGHVLRGVTSSPAR